MRTSARDYRRLDSLYSAQEFDLSLLSSVEFLDFAVAAAAGEKAISRVPTC
jgi:hypothetical protein